VRMGEVAGFVAKSELEQVRLIREARAMYDSIFHRLMRTASGPMTETARMT